jgi:hypothetical protein
MRWSTKPARLSTPGISLRAFLLGVAVLFASPDYAPADSGSVRPSAALTGPTITLEAEEVENGLYHFTGQVTAAQPGGLTVTFQGISPLNGYTVVTNADGSFSFTIQVQSSGTVAASTSDGMGRKSNTAMVDITPTP